MAKQGEEDVQVSWEDSGDIDVLPSPAALHDVNEPLRRPLTVLCMVVPVALLAEVYRFMSSQKASLLADEQWAELGAVFGIDAPLVPSLVLGLGCLGAQFIRKYTWQLPAASTVLLVLMWAGVWAAVRYAMAFTAHSVAGTVTFSEDPVHTLTALGQAGLAVSGAVQEELLFRAGILGVLAIGIWIIGLGQKGVYLVALPLSAVIFSLAHTTVINHYPGAEPLTVGNFIARFASGLLYGFIFLRQGLAVSTLAHAGYNVALVFRIGPWL